MQRPVFLFAISFGMAATFLSDAATATDSIEESFKAAVRKVNANRPRTELVYTELSEDCKAHHHFYRGETVESIGTGVFHYARSEPDPDGGIVSVLQEIFQDVFMPQHCGIQERCHALFSYRIYLGSVFDKCFDHRQ